MLSSQCQQSRLTYERICRQILIRCPTNDWNTLHDLNTHQTTQLSALYQEPFSPQGSHHMTHCRQGGKRYKSLSLGGAYDECVRSPITQCS